MDGIQSQYECCGQWKNPRSSWDSNSSSPGRSRSPLGSKTELNRLVGVSLTSRRGKSIEGQRSLRETEGSATSRMRVQLAPMMGALMSLSVISRRCLEYPLPAAQPKLVGHTCMNEYDLRLCMRTADGKFLILKGSGSS